MSDAQYQTLRSVSDNHVFVVCRDGRFYDDLPDDVRRRGPWQGMCRGDVASLRPELWLDLEEQGYVLVRTDVAILDPEVEWRPVSVTNQWCGRRAQERPQATAAGGRSSLAGDSTQRFL